VAFSHVHNDGEMDGDVAIVLEVVREQRRDRIV
jgi:hypothetical protein